MMTFSTSRGFRLSRNVIYGLALALMLLHLVVYCLYTGSLMRFPFDYDEGEGYEIQNSVYISQGTMPYFDNDVFPFYGTNYPPFFHILMAPIVALFGPAYWYGRLIVSLCTVATAAAIGYMVFRETRHRAVAWLSGLAFLASNFIFHIGPLYRQHMVMVLLETLAILAIAGYDKIADPSKQRRRIMWAIAFALMAGFTKPLAIVTALAVFGYMFLRGVKRTIAWGVVGAVVAGILFGLLLLSSQGYFWLNVITANLYDYLLFQFTGLLGMFLRLHGPLVILALALFVYELYFDRLSIYSIWLVMGSINAVLAGKWGAGDSYFAEVIAAVCILAGIFTARCLNNDWQLSDIARRFAAWSRLDRLPKATISVLGLASLGLYVVYGFAVMKLPLHIPVFKEVTQALGITSNTKFPQFYDGAGWTFGYATIGQMPTDEDIANGWKIVDLIKDDPRPILSDEAGFNFHTKTPVLTNPPHMKGLWQGGHYDPTELTGMVNAQKFGSVIIRMATSPRNMDDVVAFWPDPIVAMIKQAYQIKAVVPMNGFFYVVFDPDPKWKPT